MDEVDKVRIKRNRDFRRGLLLLPSAPFAAAVLVKFLLAPLQQYPFTTKIQDYLLQSTTTRWFWNFTPTVSTEPMVTFSNILALVIICDRPNKFGYD